MDWVYGGALGEEVSQISFVFERLPSPYDQKITPRISLITERAYLSQGHWLSAQCQRSLPLGERRFNSLRGPGSHFGGFFSFVSKCLG